VSRVPLSSLEPGGRIRIDHHGEPVELSRDGDALVARSLICTHQYCRMFWHRDSNGYRCPCHGAQFGPDGRPQTGPISVPMWTLPARIEGDEIVVGGVPAA
jgi:cytochrome b6-f complex iron-sulfur subunit